MVGQGNVDFLEAGFCDDDLMHGEGIHQFIGEEAAGDAVIGKIL